MGPPGHRHPPPFGEQSGMMAFRFGEDADAVGEGEGLSKVGESEHPLQPRNAIPLHQFPVRSLRPEFFYLRRGHPRGIAAAGDALFARQTAHSRTSLWSGLNCGSALPGAVPRHGFAAAVGAARTQDLSLTSMHGSAITYAIPILL